MRKTEYQQTRQGFLLPSVVSEKAGLEPVSCLKLVEHNGLEAAMA